MTSTVLLTGAAGTLGRALVPVLTERGERLRLLDVREPDYDIPPGADMVIGDIRDQPAVERAMDGVAAVIHAAAWHGIHLSHHPADEFWSLNVDGTFVVYEAAARQGVGRAIFSSTMGVYGRSARRAEDGPAVRVHEELPRLPTDIYGVSKVLGEETAEFYHRERGLHGAALRYGMFVPEPFTRYGIRLLYGGVDARDVASAVTATLDVLEAEPDRPFRAYNIHAPLPYDEQDERALPTDPDGVIARHWPDAPALLAQAGAKLWGPISSWYDISRARDELGWRPRHDFARFIGALRPRV